MRVLLMFSLLLILLSCQENKGDDSSKSANTLNANNLTTIHWQDTVKQLNVLQMGEKVQIRFRFKNRGNNPLLVLNATSSCGCTIADYPKQPIAEGQEGEIVAEFDTNKSHPGAFKKAITVATNTNPSNTVLLFEGEIISKDGERHPEPVPVEIPKAADNKTVS